MKLYENYSSNMSFCNSYDFQCCHNFHPFHLFWTIKKIIHWWLSIVLMLLQMFIFFQYNISYLRFFVHNEKSLDGYECEEGSHNYNKIKPQ
jgi:hypothetical protein